MCEAITDMSWLPAVLRYTAVVGVGLMLLFFLPLSYWVLGRPFDKRFEGSAKAGPEHWFGWFSTLVLRPITYAVRVVLDTPRAIEAAQKSDVLPNVWQRMDYGDFNFKQAATPLQKWFSYMYCGTTLFLIFGVAPVLEFCGL